MYSEDPKSLLPYAEKCAQAFNCLTKELVDKICEAAKHFYLTFIDEISEEWREEILEGMAVEFNK